MTQQTWDRAVVTALLAFAVSVGSLTLAALLLALYQEAHAAAEALAASTGGASVTIALRRKGQ